MIGTGHAQSDDGSGGVGQHVSDQAEVMRIAPKMEARGIAASFIAIGQALLNGRHVVNLLQEIPKIGNELASLNNEASPKIRSRVF
ncbi:hypothetical protein COL922a_010953 [Colletotrichum nupharicola]|nr:hypothetical protein COL922a_010953 [Colletotrichum nupharicola]